MSQLIISAAIWGLGPLSSSSSKATSKDSKILVYNWVCEVQRSCKVKCSSFSKQIKIGFTWDVIKRNQAGTKNMGNKFKTWPLPIYCSTSNKFQLRVWVYRTPGCGLRSSAAAVGPRAAGLGCEYHGYKLFGHEFYVRNFFWHQTCLFKKTGCVDVIFETI